MRTERELSVCAAAFAAVTCWGGVHHVTLDASANRVRTPLRVDLERIGTIRPRGVAEIRGSNWRLGCETLDRGYINFDEYKEHVAPLGMELSIGL